MPKRAFLRNDFPRVTYVVLGALIGTSALFNPVSQPVWVTLNVLVIVVSYGLAITNAVGLVLRRRRRTRTVDESPGL
jgi:predicted signal transduction protein with EAL and GGDEF domain